MRTLRSVRRWDAAPVAFAALVMSVLLCVVAAVPARAEDEIRVQAKIGKQELFLGESTAFVIDVEGTDQARPPETADFGDDFQVTFRGGQVRSESSMSFVDGRRSRTMKQTHRLQWDLRPVRAGRLVIPEIDVTVGAETFTTRTMAVRVVGPEPARSARVRLEVSRARVYVEQPLDLTVVAQIRRPSLDASPYDDDPVLPRRPLALSVAWFEGLSGFASYGHERGIRSLRRDAREAGGRFTINELQDRGTLFGDRMLEFPLARGETIIDGAPWFEYRVTKRFTPLEPGRVTLPVSTLRGRVVTKIARSGRGLTAEGIEDVFVGHEPVEIEVLPVPEAGRPATYTHAIGSYRVSATVSPNRARVGDPLELAVRVEGVGILDGLKPPALDRQTSLTELFRVGEADRLPDEDVAGRTFYFTIRPRTVDIDAVPPIDFAWFDPKKETFDTAASQPIPITVEAASVVGDAEIVRSTAPGEQRSSPGEERSGGLLGNRAVDEALADERFRPLSSALVWLLLVGPLLGLGVALVQARRIRRDGGDPWRRRQREALVRATAALERAGELEADGAAATDQLRLALAGFVVDRTGIGRYGATAESLTAGEARESLVTAGLGGDAADRLVDALAECEAARYGGGTTDLVSRRVDAQEWIEALARGSQV